MSANPRVVLTGINVPAGDGEVTYIRAGTMVDIKPGSALEALYGGAGNLRPMSPAELSGRACGTGGTSN